MQNWAPQCVGPRLGRRRRLRSQQRDRLLDVGLGLRRVAAVAVHARQTGQVVADLVRPPGQAPQADRLVAGGERALVDAMRQAGLVGPSLVDGGRHAPVVGHHLVDQPEAPGFAGSDRPAGDDQVEGGGDADQAR